MNDKTEFIVADQAIADTRDLIVHPALSYTLKSASMVCFLGQRFHKANIYMQMLAGLMSLKSGKIAYFNCEKWTQVAKYFSVIAYLSYNSRYWHIVIL